MYRTARKFTNFHAYDPANMIAMSFFNPCLFHHPLIYIFLFIIAVFESIYVYFNLFKEVHVKRKHFIFFLCRILNLKPHGSQPNSLTTRSHPWVPYPFFSLFLYIWIHFIVSNDRYIIFSFLGLFSGV